MKNHHAVIVVIVPLSPLKAKQLQRMRGNTPAERLPSYYGGYSKITPKIGLKTNCYIGAVLEGVTVSIWEKPTLSKFVLS